MYLRTTAVLQSTRDVADPKLHANHCDDSPALKRAKRRQRELVYTSLKYILRPFLGCVVERCLTVAAAVSTCTAPQLCKFKCFERKEAYAGDTSLLSPSLPPSFLPHAPDTVSSTRPTILRRGGSRNTIPGVAKTAQDAQKSRHAAHQVRLHGQPPRANVVVLQAAVVPRTRYQYYVTTASCVDTRSALELQYGTRSRKGGRGWCSVARQSTPTALQYACAAHRAMCAAAFTIFWPEDVLLL